MHGFASTSPTAFGEPADEQGQESHMSRQERAVAMHASKRERMALAQEKRRRRQLGEDDSVGDDFVAYSAQGRRQQQQRARDVASVARHVSSNAPTSARAQAGVGGGSSYEHMEAERTIAELRQQLADAPGRAAAAAKAEMLSAKRAAKTARNKCTELEQRVAELESLLAKEREEKTKLARRLAKERKKQPPAEGSGNGEGGRGKGAGNEAEFDERAARVLANAKEAAAMTTDAAARARATINDVAPPTSWSPANRPPAATPDQGDAVSEQPAQADGDGLLSAEEIGDDLEQRSAVDVPTTPPPASLSQPGVESTKPAQAPSVAVTAQPPPARRGRAAAEPGGGRRARRQEKTPHKVATPAKPNEEAEEPPAPVELTGEWALPKEEPLSIAVALAEADSAEPDEEDDAMALLRQRHASDSAARSPGRPEDNMESSEAVAQGATNVMPWGDAGGDLAPRALLSGDPDASLMSEGIFDTDTKPSGSSPVSRTVDGAVEEALSEATNTGSSWAEVSRDSSPVSSSTKRRANNDDSSAEVTSTGPEANSAEESSSSECRIDQQQEELDDLVRELMEEQPHLTREECEAAIKDAMGGRMLVPNAGHDLTELDEPEEELEDKQDEEETEEDKAAGQEDLEQHQEDGMGDDEYSDDNEHCDSTDTTDDVCDSDYQERVQQEQEQDQDQQDHRPSPSSPIAMVAGSARSQSPSAMSTPGSSATAIAC